MLAYMQHADPQWPPQSPAATRSLVSDPSFCLGCFLLPAPGTRRGLPIPVVYGRRLIRRAERSDIDSKGKDRALRRRCHPVEQHYFIFLRLYWLTRAVEQQLWPFAVRGRERRAVGQPHRVPVGRDGRQRPARRCRHRTQHHVGVLQRNGSLRPGARTGPADRLTYQHIWSNGNNGTGKVMDTWSLTNASHVHPPTPRRRRHRRHPRLRRRRPTHRLPRGTSGHASRTRMSMATPRGGKVASAQSPFAPKVAKQRVSGQLLIINK